MSAFVLYVDDDPSNLVIFQASFKNAFPLLTATSGADALALMQKNEVAVLLTDQRMPGMSGVELMEKVRVDYPDVVRMLVTAYSDLDAAIGSINRGQAHLYWRKPWEPLSLKMALIQARERYLAGRQVTELERRLAGTERVYALGVVAAGIAHELRNPLSALSLNLELIEQLVRDEGPTRAELEQARKAAADSRAAIKAITDITRSIEASTRSTVEGEIDLKEIIETSMTAIRGELRRRGQISLQLQEVPLVKGSRTRLGQVVLNLLVNALEALAPEKVATNLVTVKLRTAQAWVEFEVSDNGQGVDSALKEKIFDPFFTTKPEGGTGLGLAISRQIVADLNGTLEVKSEGPGAGSVFVVRLPASNAQY